MHATEYSGHGNARVCVSIFVSHRKFSLLPNELCKQHHSFCGPVVRKRPKTSRSPSSTASPCRGEALQAFLASNLASATSRYAISSGASKGQTLVPECARPRQQHIVFTAATTTAASTTTRTTTNSSTTDDDYHCDSGTTATNTTTTIATTTTRNRPNSNSSSCSQLPLLPVPLL